MPEYRYKAKDTATGKIIKNKMMASDEATFYREIEKKGLVAIEVNVKSDEEVSIPYKFKLKELSVFCREFSIFMDAGIPVVEALNKLNNRTKKKRKKEVYMFLIESVEKGNPLAESMEKLGNVFPEMLIQMVRIGETSGTIETVMNRMALYYEKEHKNRSNVQTALIYPVTLIVVTIGVVVLLFTFVMPKFFGILDKDSIPLITKIFMWLSGVLVNDWMYILLAVALVGIGYGIFVSTPKGRYLVDKFMCNIPVISKLMEKGTIARFSNTMGMLTSSGIVILESLEICARTLGNKYLISKLDHCREEVQKGESLSTSMERDNLFEDLVWSMIATGEETGNSEEMYEKLSHYYEQESEAATAKLMALMQPVLLVVIGVIVALAVASILLPIYQSYGSMG